MRIDHYHHIVRDDACDPIRSIHRTLSEILRRVVNIEQQGEELMTAAEQMKQSLVEANEATNEIAADLQALQERLANQALTNAEAEDVQAQLSAMTERLRNVAASWTPEMPTPEEPPVEPPVEPPTDPTQPSEGRRRR